MGRKTGAAGAPTAKGAESLMKALAVIEFVAKAEKPPKVAVIAEALGLPRPTAYRITAALAQKSYLRLAPEVQGYRLGYRLFELAYASWRDLDISGAAGPVMEELRDRVGETVVLTLRTGTNVVVVDRRDCLHDIRPVIAIGHTEAMSRSLFGLSILSFLPASERAAVTAELPPQWSERGLSPDVMDRLAAARGYALQTSEFDEAVSGVGAPILDFHGAPFASLSIVGPSSRLPESQLHRLAPLLLDAARRVTRNAGKPEQSIRPRPRPRGIDSVDFEQIAEADCLLGEAPIWDEKRDRLYWIDIFAPAIHCWDRRDGAHRRQLCRDLPGALCLTEDGRLLVASPSGVDAVDPDTLDRTGALIDLEKQMWGARFNDGGVDPQGRFLLGVMDLGVKDDHGYLAIVDPKGGAMRRAVSNLTLPNGICWSPDGTLLYVADSTRGLIQRYAYDPARSVTAPPEVFARIPREVGAPDGMAVDREGGLWVALWDGWSIARFDARGRMLAQYAMPMPRPTSLCFGGPDLRTLYVTSAYVRLTAEQLKEAPLSGAVVAFETDAQGSPARRFRAV